MDYLQYGIVMKEAIIAYGVLNLIINGLPSIYIEELKQNWNYKGTVLNLIINGLPSILLKATKLIKNVEFSFKPYYKWITFNILK